MTFCQYGCKTELHPYDRNDKKTPRYELDGTKHDYNRCVSLKGGKPANEAKKNYQEFKKEFADNKENEHDKKVDAGISTIIELLYKHDIMFRDMNKKIHGEENEQILYSLQEENAGQKEALRQKMFEQGSNIKQ